MPVPSKSELKKLYDECDGVIVNMADRLELPNTTVSYWCRKYKLRGKGKGGQEKLAPPNDQLIALHARFKGNLAAIAGHLGMSRSALHEWMAKIGLAGKGRQSYDSAYPQVIKEKLDDGFILCFSDAHLWFEEKSRAHEALLVAARKLKPTLVVANGDVLDGARISRHDASGLDPTPRLADEIHVAKMHMAELARVCKDSRRYFTMGNHDSRLSRYLAIHAPEMDDVDGSRLDHHILGWTFCMSLTVNDDIVIKHAFRGGIHATWNNTLHDGRTIVTGHLHAQMVRPFTDARGTRYGFDLGCLADPTWPQFNYTIANTKNWRSGFGVLEIRDGKLLPPMLATVLDDGSVNLQRNERLL